MNAARTAFLIIGALIFIIGLSQLIYGIYSAYKPWQSELGFTICVATGIFLILFSLPFLWIGRKFREEKRSSK